MVTQNPRRFRAGGVGSLVISFGGVQGDVVCAAQIVVTLQRGQRAFCLGGQGNGHGPVPVVVAGHSGGGVFLVHHGALIIEVFVFRLALGHEEAEIEVGLICLCINENVNNRFIFDKYLIE